MIVFELMETYSDNFSALNIHAGLTFQPEMVQAYLAPLNNDGSQFSNCYHNTLIIENNACLSLINEISCCVVTLLVLWF